MPHYLEPIIQNLLGDASSYVDAMHAAAKAALEAAAANDNLINSIHDVDAMLEDAAATARLSASGLNDFRDAAATTGAALDGVANRVNDMRDAMVSADAAVTSMNTRLGDLAAKSVYTMMALAALDDELDKKKAALAGAGLDAAALALALKGLQVASKDSGDGAARSAAGFRLWGTGIRLTGTAIHWLVAGTAEFLAVAIPATVAGAAWAAVWLQGATNVAQHMQAVYTATEATSAMFHTTAGQAVGLGNALQKAQDAANPDVYQALGGVINTIKETMGGLATTGLQVGRIFDTFMAKVVYDFSAAAGAGAKLQGLMSGMIPDLVEFGQIFGNIGHALLNFAAAMPGVSQVLLRLADDISRVILWISKLPPALITTFMVFEEFNRYGGVVVSILGKLGIAMDGVSGKVLSLTHTKTVFMSLFQGILGIVPGAISLLARLATALKMEGTAAALEGVAAKLTGLIGSVNLLGAVAITALAVGLGLIIDKLATARSFAQQFDDSLQRMADRASNLSVLQTLAAGISTLSDKTKVLASATYHDGQVTVTATRNSAAYHDALAAAAATQQSMISQMVTVAGHAQALAKQYGMSLPGAMALADAAGVKLNQTMTRQAWAIAQIKIRDLVQGYQSMGAPLGAVGADIQAVAIQSGVAASKVSQLNQAWDQFMQGVTGGTTGLAGFENSLANMGSVAAHASNNLAESTVKMSAGTRQFANNLKSFTGQGAQAWQNFGQVVGSTAPQLIDWLRQAGAEGAISGKQFTTAVRDMVAQLLPLASHSKSATMQLSVLAHQAGGPTTTNFQTLKRWVDQGHLSLAGLAMIVQDATTGLGDMAKVAQNLGDVMAGQVTAALSGAALKAAGFTTDIKNLAAAQGGPGVAAGHSAQYWANAAATAYQNAQTKAAGWTTAIGQAGNAANSAAGQVNGLSSALRNIPSYKQITLDYRVIQSISAPGTPAPGTGIIPNAPGGNRRVFDSGGYLMPGYTLAYNGTGRPEPVGGAIGGVTVHVHGSVSTEQDLVRSIQAGLNRKTLRNGSTQTFIPGRAH